MTCQLSLLLVLLPVSRSECTHNSLDSVPVLELISMVNCVTERKTASHKAASVLMRNTFWFLRYISLWYLSEGGYRPSQAGLPSQNDGRGWETERLSPTYARAAGSRPAQRDQSQKRSELLCEWFMLESSKQAPAALSSWQRSLSVAQSRPGALQHWMVMRVGQNELLWFFCPMTAPIFRLQHTPRILRTREQSK